MNVIKAEVLSLEDLQQDYERFDDNDEESQNALLESVSSYLNLEEVVVISSDELFSISDDPEVDYKSLEERFYNIVNSLELSGNENLELVVHHNDFGTKIINDQYDGTKVVLFINPESDTYTLFMSIDSFKLLFDEVTGNDSSS